jgi:RND family efflux transporter MFP subunit
MCMHWRMDELWMKGNSGKNRTRLIIGLVCAVISLTGCGLLPQEEAALKPPLMKPDQEKMELYEVKRGEIVRNVRGTATFVSDNMHTLYFRESGGRLQSMDVRVGSVVKQGDVIARLEQGDLDNRMKQQQIVVEKAKLELERVKEEKSMDRIAIRMKELDLRKEQLELEYLQSRIQNTVLLSPISGIVTYMDSMQQGDPIAAYKPIVTISDPSSLKLVYMDAQPSDLVGIQVGMEVDINYHQKPLKGTVMQIPATAPLEENKALAERNAKSVVIVVESPPEEAAVGGSAEISILLDKRENVLVIPTSGLRSYQGREYVQILDGERRKEVDVEKGIATQMLVEIRSGLKEGQNIIMNH